MLYSGGGGIFQFIFKTVEKYYSLTASREIPHTKSKTNKQIKLTPEL